MTGSTAVFSECQECHNHRFCTVSGEAIHSGNSHVHEVKFRTDFADEHSHDFCGKTGPAMEVGNGKHIHFISDCTEFKDGHVHKFQAATLIDSPTDFKYMD
ncbi:MAG: YmaF family protein [Lachnospiraceae bacterium]